MSAQRITVETIIAANIRKTWDCYTQPRDITKWNFASDDWHCPAAENDLRVGGKMKSRMEAKDGSFGFDFEATYDEVIPLKTIAYTMPDGRRSITEFASENGRTKVTTRFDAEQQNPIEMQRGGWQAILDNFRKHVEKRNH